MLHSLIQSTNSMSTLQPPKHTLYIFLEQSFPVNLTPLISPRSVYPGMGRLRGAEWRGTEDGWVESQCAVSNLFQADSTHDRAVKKEEGEKLAKVSFRTRPRARTHFHKIKHPLCITRNSNRPTQPSWPENSRCLAAS